MGTVKRAYYTAIFAGLYGTAGLALAVSVLCSGCGSRPAGDFPRPSRWPIGRVAALPAAWTSMPVSAPVLMPAPAAPEAEGPLPIIVRPEPVALPDAGREIPPVLIPEEAPPIFIPAPGRAPEPEPEPVATIQPVGPAIPIGSGPSAAAPNEGDDARIGPPPAR
jgi:hypothetical protein